MKNTEESCKHETNKYYGEDESTALERSETKVTGICKPLSHAFYDPNIYACLQDNIFKDPAWRILTMSYHYILLLNIMSQGDSNTVN